MRLFNLPLDPQKKISFFLQQIFGINKFSALVICKQIGFSSETPIQVLKLRHISLIKQTVLKNFSVASELKRGVEETIKDLILIKSYRGFRHRLNLPVRGQRTRTNRKTRRIQK